MRIVWQIFGLTSLVLGELGVALPLLPTTCLVILTAFCFARSSPALHGWLLHDRTFGKTTRDWRAHRGVDCQACAINALTNGAAQPARNAHRR